MAIVRGGNGNDPFLFGTDLNDEIYGFAGIDTLLGFNGNDYLDGGTGNDVMEGGNGSDTYVVDSAGDRIVVRSGDGFDTVLVAFTYTLGPYLEGLTLTGGLAINGFGNLDDNILVGNNAANQLFGNIGNDSLVGLGGNDLLDGGRGNDTLNGGTGDDTFVVDSEGDEIFERFGDGDDTVRSSVNFVLSQALENLELQGTATRGTGNQYANRITGNAVANNVLDGEGGNDFIFGGGRADSIEGGFGNDFLSGENGNDTLEGGQGNDIMYGGAGNDLLAATYGVDTMYGGSGNDTYRVYSTLSRVIEFANEGVDTVLANVSLTLAPDVENLELLLSAKDGTGNALANRITGNQYGNVLDGKAGVDTMYGELGNDIYHVDDTRDRVIELSGQGNDTVLSKVTYVLGADVEILELTGKSAINGTGNALNNTLYGNIGSNALDGKAGTDTMYGRRGNDFYTVDNALDRAIELANEGTDTVNAFVTFTLGANVENLILRGTGVIDGTGNTLANILTGNISDNLLSGGAGNDTLFGGSGNDTLEGGLDNDLLAGGDGVDHYDGGDGILDTVSYEGSTTSLVASFLNPLDNTGDAAGETYSGIEVLIGTNVAGAGDTLVASDSFGAMLLGLDGHDTLFGRAGNDTLEGGLGNDSIYGGLFDSIDIIDGGEGNDLLFGEGGADTITGGRGQDTMNGGAGADVFRFNFADESEIGFGDVVNGFSGSGLQGDTLDFALMPTATVKYFIGDLAFRAIGFAEIRATLVNGGIDTLVEMDTDGNGTADMEFTLTGVTSLVITDFSGVLAI